MRDFQRQRVYNWQDQYIKYEGRSFTFDQLQAIVNQIWVDFHLLYPPKVVPLHKNSKNLGMADRNKIFFPEEGITTEATVLHEVAHSMLDLGELGGHQHNEFFVGLFMELLETYLGYEKLILFYTANKANVKFELNVKPIIIDGR